MRKMMVNSIDTEIIEMMFAEMATALGYDAWYECEEEWEDMELMLIGLGCDIETVENFFSEMAWDL